MVSSPVHWDYMHNCQWVRHEGEKRVERMHYVCMRRGREKRDDCGFMTKKKKTKKDLRFQNAS